MRRLLSKAGIDRPVVYALAARLWSLASSFATLTLIVLFLSAEEQGFYYTFSAILGAQILFELGMGLVVMQFASHSMARLDWTPGGRLEGDATELMRLRSLVRLTARWYAVLALILMLVLGPLGWLFIERSAPHSSVHWQAAWVWVVVAAAAYLIVQVQISILEGCQCIEQMNRLRLIQGVCSSVFAWITITSGGGLFALAAWNTAMALSAAFALIWMRGGFFKQMFERSVQPVTQLLSWRREIWPFQWRIAVSWMSGYLIFQLFVPALFSAHGAVEAGQMGLSLAIANALMGLSLAWLNTKVPQFGQLISTHRYDELDSMWRHTTWRSLVLLSVGGFAVLTVAWILQAMGTRLGGRLLAPLPFALLIAATIVNFITIAQASYLRAHKEEPFLYVSLANGATVAVLTGVLALPCGATGIMLGYLGAALCFGSFWGSRIFLHKRRSYRSIAVTASTDKVAPYNA